MIVNQTKEIFTDAFHLLRHFTKAAFQRFLAVACPMTIMLNRPSELRHHVDIPVSPVSFLNCS